MQQTYNIPGTLSKDTQGGGRTDANSDVLFTTHTNVRHVQLTAYQILLKFVSRKPTHLWSPVKRPSRRPRQYTFWYCLHPPAGTGAPATTVSFVNAPSHRPRRPREVLQLTSTSLSLEPPTPPLDTAGHPNHAPSPGALATTAHFANAPYPLTIPHVAPPGYTYQQ